MHIIIHTNMKKITYEFMGYYILLTIKGILSSELIPGTHNTKNNYGVKHSQNSKLGYVCSSFTRLEINT